MPSLLLNANGEIVDGSVSSETERQSLKKDFSKKLTTFEAKSDLIDDPTCSVCLCDYELRDQISMFSDTTPSTVSKLTCGHVFHFDCVALLLKQWKNECPKCRGEAVPT